VPAILQKLINNKIKIENRRSATSLKIFGFIKYLNLNIYV
jgi:hypothetical protein